MKKEYDCSKGKRGRVVAVPQGKTRVTVRLDDDVLQRFRDQVDKAGGGNYQSLINQALRDFVERRREPLESTLRRVFREELRQADWNSQDREPTTPDLPSGREPTKTLDDKREF